MSIEESLWKEEELMTKECYDKYAYTLYRDAFSELRDAAMSRELVFQVFADADRLGVTDAEMGEYLESNVRYRIREMLRLRNELEGIWMRLEDQKAMNENVHKYSSYVETTASPYTSLPQKKEEDERLARMEAESRFAQQEAENGREEAANESAAEEASVNPSAAQEMQEAEAASEAESTTEAAPSAQESLNDDMSSFIHQAEEEEGQADASAASFPHQEEAAQAAETGEETTFAEVEAAAEVPSAEETGYDAEMVQEIRGGLAEAAEEAAAQEAASEPEAEQKAAPEIQILGGGITAGEPNNTIAPEEKVTVQETAVEAAPSYNTVSSGVARAVFSVLLFLVILILIWLVANILMYANILPQMDFGYQWFNEHVFPIFWV